MNRKQLEQTRREIKLDMRYRLTKLMQPIIRNLMLQKLLYDQPIEKIINKYFKKKKNRPKIDKVVKETRRLIEQNRTNKNKK